MELFSTLYYEIKVFVLTKHLVYLYFHKSTTAYCLTNYPLRYSETEDFSMLKLIFIFF